MISDREVILKIKRGEIDAFSRIVELYTNNIYRYVRMKLFEKADVDDVVQNIFISFYKALSRFDEAKPILPYLFQIAKNELKMYYRSHKQVLQLDESLVVDSGPTDYYKEDYTGVVNSLTGDQKNILQLLIDGYSYQEIANKIHRPINTIRTMIRRSRLQIIKQYHEKT